MKIKCGRNEFDLNEKDIIMYNGACYQLITRKLGFGYDSKTPILGKTIARRLIKEKKLKEINLENPPFNDKELIYYSI